MSSSIASNESDSPPISSTRIALALSATSLGNHTRGTGNHPPVDNVTHSAVAEHFTPTEA